MLYYCLIVRFEYAFFFLVQNTTTEISPVVRGASQLVIDIGSHFLPLTRNATAEFSHEFSRGDAAENEVRLVQEADLLEWLKSDEFFSFPGDRTQFVSPS